MKNTPGKVTNCCIFVHYFLLVSTKLWNMSQCLSISHFKPLLLFFLNDNPIYFIFFQLSVFPEWDRWRRWNGRVLDEGDWKILGRNWWWIPGQTENSFTYAKVCSFNHEPLTRDIPSISVNPTSMNEIGSVLLEGGGSMLFYIIIGRPKQPSSKVSWFLAGLV